MTVSMTLAHRHERPIVHLSHTTVISPKRSLTARNRLPDMLVPCTATNLIPVSRRQWSVSPTRVSGLDALDVSPRLLRCFVAVADELHFGRAADRLFVAQPALSRSVQQLERILGRRLFTRTTRSVALTAAAMTLLPAAREVLDSLDALAGTLAHDQRALRVAHVASCDTTALILDHLARTEPAVRVQEETMTGAEQLAAVRDGCLDVAICRVPDHLESRLRSCVIRYDPVLVALLGRHATSERPINPAQRTVFAADGGVEESDYAAFLTEFENAAGCRLRRVPVAASSGTEAYAMRRAGALAFVTLASRGVRLDCARHIVGTAPLQAYHPWSAVWRRGERTTAVPAFLAAAEQVASARRWRDLDGLPGTPWLPAAGSHRAEPHVGDEAQTWTRAA
jgi:DNA-binding transcriptional LysR family regulator